MSRRDSLRKLAKKFPAPPELRKILDEARDHSDRSAAIIVTAVIEALLEKLIVRRQIHTTSQLIEQLFKNRGPLSDFHSKILIAVAFGIVTPQMGEEFHRLKRVRNVFAHATVDVTFDTPEIAQEIEGSPMLAAMYGAAEKSNPPEKPFRLSSKAAYLLIARLLCIILSGHHKQFGGEELLGD